MRKAVRFFDRDLDAIMSGDQIQIIRRTYRWDNYSIPHATLRVLMPQPQLLFAVTDDWKVTGNPVERGIEPILHMLRSMDSWGSSISFDEMKRAREDAERDRNRQHYNELKAVAADCRRDFAKATSEINTSTLKKIDRRRRKEKWLS